MAINRSHDEIHTITIEPKSGDEGETKFSPRQWSEVLKTSISEKWNEIPVIKSTLTAKGVGYASFPDRESRDKAAEALKEEFQVVENDTKRRPLLPKLKICDLSGFSKTDTDKLRLIIPKKNSAVRKLVDEGAALDVIFIKEPTERQYGYAVVRVDPRIREEIIKNQRRIFIDTNSYHASDQVHVTQCFVCQKFAHKKNSEHCSLKDTEEKVCLYCSENHESGKCTNKGDKNKHKCANCHGNHTSTSYTCPVLKKEADTIIRLTNIDPKNFPIQMSTQRQSEITRKS